MVTAKNGKFIEFAAPDLFSGLYDITQAALVGTQTEPNWQVTACSYDL
jgi:hypothetical protein